MNHLFEYTGNPFVDTGLAVMVAMSDKQTLSEVDKSDFIKMFSNAEWLGVINRKLKAYSSVIGTNGPLTQTSYSKNNTYIGAEKAKQKFIKEQNKCLIELSKVLKANKLNGLRNEIESLNNEINKKSNENEKKKANIKLEKKEKAHAIELHKLESQKKRIEKKLTEVKTDFEIIENRLVKQSDRGLSQYSAVIEALVKEVISATAHAAPLCEITGIYPSTQIFFSLGEIISQKFQLTSEEKEKSSDYQIGRDWFPLAGSLGNDAQALPAGSRSPNISALALLAAQLLPMGVIAVKRQVKGESKSYLACLQFNIPEVNELIVKRNYDNVYSKVQLASEKNKVQTIGTGKGSKSLTLFLIEQLKNLPNRKEFHGIEHLHLNVWLFSNFGTSADCVYFEIPSPSLQFIIKAAQNFYEELHEMLIRETNKTKSLLDTIENHEDYKPLYPNKNSKKAAKEWLDKARRILENFDEDENNELVEASLEDNKSSVRKTLIEQLQARLKKIKKDKSQKDGIEILIAEIEKSQSRPASKELFKLYQIKVVGIHQNALLVAERIALYLKSIMTTEKEQKILDSWIKNDPDKRVRQEKKTIIRAKIVEMAIIGKITLDDYICLFPKETQMPLRTTYFGWEYLWFYLNHEKLEDSVPNFIGDYTMLTHPKIKSFAEDYFDFCMNTKKYSNRKFEKNVLEKFKNNQVSAKTMQDWFCELASDKETYSSEEWDGLCKDENGNEAIYEVRFQLRLHFINLYREFNQNFLKNNNGEKYNV